ncbi:hypothetical protein C8Q80DRAFT_1061905, partial [Daedaleopsis nitida]
FDNDTFDSDNRVVFDLVPWPVLEHPFALQDELICWPEIEGFFEAGIHVKGITYEQLKTLISDTQRRFHPDRWSSR